MTASATTEETREDTGAWPWTPLRIDFEAFEAFHAPGQPTVELPLIVRWFGCFARGESL